MQMKTKSLRYVILFLCGSLLFASCKKSDVKEPEQPVLSSKDPQAISAAVKVWHGERIQGNAPAPKGSGLQLDASASAPVTHAFAGRYAIIQPSIEQGDVAGYYLQFNNSKEYFKIDYSKPRGGRVRPGTKPASPFNRDPRQSRAQNGNADSAIVIALPANLQVPDTFCISYCAYDLQGNISNVVTTCVIVNSLGADANGTWVNGIWKNTASWDTSLQYRDTIIFNKWSASAYNWGYVCYFDSTSGINQLTYNFQNTGAIVNDSTYYTKSHLTFGSNGGLKYNYQSKYKYLDFSVSTCSQHVFITQPDDIENYTGAWNYNSATGKMVLVFEFDDNGTPSLEAWEYKMIKVNNNNIVLMDDSYGYPYYIRFEK
jgi:hypothetical protein